MKIIISMHFLSIDQSIKYENPHEVNLELKRQGKNENENIFVDFYYCSIIVTVICNQKTDNYILLILETFLINFSLIIHPV